MFLQFATQLALSAGNLVRKGARDGCGIYHKEGPRDIVTDIDLASEKFITEAIRNRYPEHDILTEESPPDQRTSRYRWIIDPLDGTTNFVHGYPCYAISIALTFNDCPIVGVVHDLVRDDLFAAAKGRRATHNGLFVHVSQADQLADAVIGVGWAGDEKTRASTLRVLQQLKCGTIRICGSAALGLCYVAAGWCDAYFHLRLQPWDAAAASLIIHEAGGRITNVAGKPWQLDIASCVASNGQLHSQLRGYVRESP